MTHELCLFFTLDLYLFIYLFIYLSIHSFIHLFTYLFIYLYIFFTFIPSRHRLPDDIFKSL